jgi:hypothetical protein
MRFQLAKNLNPPVNVSYQLRFLLGAACHIDTSRSRRGLIYDKIHQKFNLSESAAGTQQKANFSMAYLSIARFNLIILNWNKFNRAYF